MKKFLFLSILLLARYAGCQSPAYTSITATLIDGQGQIWANASWTATIIPPFGNPTPLNNGGIPTLGTVSGVADNSGNISTSLDDNLNIKPSGSVWRFTICPNATVKVCSTSIQVITGTTMNLSASLSADLSNINVATQPTLYRAYTDTEVTGGQGAIYWRTSDNTLRGFNGSAWVAVGGGGGGSSTWSSLLSPTGNLTLAMLGNTTTFNMGGTGTTGAAFDITDSNDNHGTNYLLRVWTGSGSTAKTVAFCSNNTTDCIQFASASLTAIGNAGITATQVINNSTGIGVMQLGSNGSGSVSQANTVKIMGNSNQLYASENGAVISKVLLGGQINCASGVVQSIDNAGNVTCNVPLASVAPFQVQAVNANTTNFSALFGIGAFPAAGNTGTEYNTAMPFTGTIKGMYVTLTTGQPGTGSLVFTLRKNGFDQSLSITVPAGSGQLSWSATGSVAFNATDLLDVKIVNNASAGSANIVSGLVTY